MTTTSSVPAMIGLLEEVTAHLNANSAKERTVARKKLERIVALASTLALTLSIKR